MIIVISFIKLGYNIKLHKIRKKLRILLLIIRNIFDLSMFMMNNIVIKQGSEEV